MEITYLSAPTVTLVTQGGELYEYDQFTVRQPYGPRVRQVMHNPYPSLAVDSAGNDTDINIIMSRFERTGILPPATTEPQYADVVDLQGDLTELHAKAHSALEIANKFAEAWKPPQPAEESKPTTTTSIIEPPASTPQT